MKYKDKVSSLLQTVENRLISLKRGVENNALGKEQIFSQVDLMLKDLEFAQNTVDLEDREF